MSVSVYVCVCVCPPLHLLELAFAGLRGGTEREETDDKQTFYARTWHPSQLQVPRLCANKALPKKQRPNKVGGGAVAQGLALERQHAGPNIWLSAQPEPKMRQLIQSSRSASRTHLRQENEMKAQQTNTYTAQRMQNNQCQSVPIRAYPWLLGASKQVSPEPPAN
jgi:hypothetical protein